MTDFFRFPHTGHLTWLGQDMPRDDKLLAPGEVDALFADEVVVEEKLDGANIGISLDDAGELRVQNRGQYLQAPYKGQFSRLNAWLAQHQYALHEFLDSDTILFGEWCAAVHSIEYSILPDWFLLFDLYDRPSGRFASQSRRNQLATEVGLTVVPELLRGIFELRELLDQLEVRQSQYSDALAEGFVVRCDAGDWCQARGKIVRADFTQSIETHWSQNRLRWNRVALPSSA
ncbi:RNA ligase family protein [Pelagibius sp. Alg239-R121]|uniref:RNA ligase family protein n=1 Tax=Pelagibius sp. Alg239-R121 TaxID=2993448 RepID=UPI0024A7741F|nr:RNA ligase family protein [Pelagibius sp. Alg239-R121]